MSDFNRKHKGQVSLLDFSNYATSFGELKNGPIKKSDLDVIQEFQKRKIDQRVHNLRMDKIREDSIDSIFFIDLVDIRLQEESYLDDPLGHEESEQEPWTKPEEKEAESYQQK